MVSKKFSLNSSFSLFLTLFTCLLVLAACSGSENSDDSSSSGDNSSSGEITKVTSGIAVDPYIVGATFFEDENGNGRWDAGEQISTPSDENGRFSFNEPVKAGSTIVMLERGKHQGVPFTGRLMRRVDQNDPATVVVSPLTTYAALGLGTKDLAPSLDGLNQSYAYPGDYDVTADPMAGLDSITSLNATAPDHFETMANIRANLYIGAVLEMALIHRDIHELSSYDIQDKLNYWDPLANLKEGLLYAVNSDAIDRIGAKLEEDSELSGKTDLPAVTMREVAETMPAIINWWKQELIRKAVENQKVQIAAEDFKALIDQVQGELGLHYYLRNNHEHSSRTRELDPGQDNHPVVTENGTVGQVKEIDWENYLPGMELHLGDSSRLIFFNDGSVEIANGNFDVTGTWNVEDNLLILGDNVDQQTLELEMESDWSSHLALSVNGELPDYNPNSFVGKFIKEAKLFQLM